jgi:DNA-binding response OmpR family regulator
MSSGAMAEPQAPQRVLIVEDDRETRELLAGLLGSEGFEVFSAASGLKLISLLRADQPDLIILDVNLSWIDGFELCRSVKQNEDFGHIPVVFLSGRTSPEDVEKGLLSGAEAYFSKPVDFEDLVTRLRAILAARPERTGGDAG